MNAVERMHPRERTRSHPYAAAPLTSVACGAMRCPRPLSNPVAWVKLSAMRPWWFRVHPGSDFCTPSTLFPQYSARTEKNAVDSFLRTTLFFCDFRRVTLLHLLSSSTACILHSTDCLIRQRVEANLLCRQAAQCKEPG